MVQFCQLQAALHIIPDNILLDILPEELLNWVLAVSGSPAQFLISESAFIDFELG